MRVLITQEIDEAGVQILQAAGLTLDIHPGPAPLPPEDLRARAIGCAGLLTMLADPIDDALLATPGLRVVAQHAVGVNNIDLEAARRRGVVVTHTPGVLTAATADLTLALLLATARRLVEADAYVRAGRFVGWSPTLLRGLELDGATLGIVGYGRIGQAVAQRASAFGMRILHHARSGGTPLADLLAQSDVVSLHCPLTPQTHHLIDAAALARMKPGSILLNTARGPVVDEAALVAALQRGQLGGAGLDVFEDEPRLHPGLRDLPSVVLAPHIGSATWTARRKMAVMTARDLVAVLQGQAPQHPVS